MVILEEHNPQWEQAASYAIGLIKGILKEDVLDIQHVGSTAIKYIAAKPIIDIAVGTMDFDKILLHKTELEENGIIFRGNDQPEQLLFVMGDFHNDTRTHHIHVVKYMEKQWNNYIAFRDYFNGNEEIAKEYEALKMELTRKYPDDRISYTEGKKEFILRILEEAVMEY
ncbi:MAG: GrpB family protein [Lachnospiraceae bacterium]|nr:GrpB family protein [Lachnospiraceae bacterium]